MHIGLGLVVAYMAVVILNVCSPVWLMCLVIAWHTGVVQARLTLCHMCAAQGSLGAMLLVRHLAHSSGPFALPHAVFPVSPPFIVTLPLPIRMVLILKICQRSTHGHALELHFT